VRLETGAVLRRAHISSPFPGDNLEVIMPPQSLGRYAEI
jgi:hypothetical protein